MGGSICLRDTQRWGLHPGGGGSLYRVRVPGISPEHVRLLSPKRDGWLGEGLVISLNHFFRGWGRRCLQLQGALEVR